MRAGLYPVWQALLSDLPTVKLIRGRIVKRRMQANPVIIGRNIHEHRLSYVLAVCLPSKVSSSLFRVLKIDSAQALSRQFPFRLMLWRTEGHRSPRVSRKAFAQYCAPPVGMEYQAIPGLPVGKGHLEGGNGRMDGLHAGTESPANDLPVIDRKSVV
jgi:hypothetical protein